MRYRKQPWCLPALTLLCAISTLVAPVLAASGDGPTATVQSGEVAGVSRDQVDVFLGIPYASPPVGELRWDNPYPAEAWSGVRQATEYAPFCAQLKTLGDFSALSTDEDCLYLNVFTPEGGAEGKPVMLWLHGGGNYLGMSNGYDGSVLAREQDVVVVTANFRLGALGQVVMAPFDQEGKAINLLLKDQEFAMQWVQDNIAAFKGDPGNVTVFGESNGGTNTFIHLASPAAKGLFHRVILESGSTRFWHTPTLLPELEAMGVDFATSVGCEDISRECLLAVPAETLIKAYEGTWWHYLSMVDDIVNPATPMRELIESGNFNQVPIMNVVNKNEDRWFMAFEEVTTGHVITADEISARLEAAYGDNTATVAAEYKIEDFDSPAGLLAAASGDQLYICQSFNLNRAASEYVPVYAVEFADDNSPGVLPPTSFPLLSSHTHEIQYIFPGWKGVYEGDVTPFTPEQEALAKEMRSIWATFARTGALPEQYPAYTADNERVISLETPAIRVSTTFREDHHCDMWDGLRMAAAN